MLKIKTCFALLTSILILGLGLVSCTGKNYSIIGTWQMAVNTQTYGLEFKNYGVVRATYLNGSQWGDYNYTYSEPTLRVTIDPKSANEETFSGSATFSADGNTLTISSFVNPENLHAVGVNDPIANGIYYKQ
jgi:hypothetical protein